MEFIERLQQLSEKLKAQASAIATEEATKNAFIMPFISQVLGYDVFDPREVVPEFVCDVGTKKGEKIDYAIFKNGELQILIECKKIGEDLSNKNASQLFRYFHVTNARIAILTNGRIFRFFTDLDAPNKMDEKPFLELDLLTIDESLVHELRKITKGEFDIASIINAAEEMKYVSQTKAIIRNQFHSPSDDYVRLIAAQVYDGKLTEKIREQFLHITKKALAQFINDQINERLKVAMSDTATMTRLVDVEPQVANAEQPLVATTLEEIESFQIIRAIVRNVIDVKRVTYRDHQSYFAVLVDNNNRKPLCRMHLNRSNRYIGLFDSNRVETRLLIQNLDDIFAHADHLRASAKAYCESPSTGDSGPLD